MNRLLIGGAVLATIFSIHCGPTAAQTLVPCPSSPMTGIMVQEGFDCEIFVDVGTIQRPTGLAVEDNGNVLATQSGGSVAAEPVFRFSPDGDLLAVSDPIVDPDGVAVDSMGRIFVAGSPVTIVNSLDGGVDEVCRLVPGNMQDVAVDSQGRIVVMDIAGNVSEVVCNTSDELCVSLGSIGTGVAFDDSDRLFAAILGGAGGLFRIDQCGPPGSTVLIAPLAGARRIAFGPGGLFGDMIFVTDENVVNQGRIVQVDEATGDVTEFATGFRQPNGIAFQGPGVMYVTEIVGNRLIRIFPEAGALAHFQCYEAKGDDVDLVVTLEDQFDATEALVGKPRRFCNPVDKNGEGITDPTAHLTCYEIGGDDDDDDGEDAVRREVVVNNQFGEQILTTGAARLLCVPSDKLGFEVIEGTDDDDDD